MNFLAWIGTSTSIAGAFLVALGYMQSGYTCFLVGSLSWLVVAASKRDRALAVLNGTFFLANVLGLYNAFFA